MKKSVWIAIIIGAIVAIGGGLSSPLFYETNVNESLPGKLNEMEEEIDIQATIDEIKKLDKERDELELKVKQDLLELGFKI